MKARKGMARHGQGKATEGMNKDRQGKAFASLLVGAKPKFCAKTKENVPPKQKAKFVFFLNARLNLIFQVSSIQKQVSCDIICT